jgi:integrase
MESLSGKITKRSVDAVTAPAEGRTHLWDTDVKGFFLRVYPGGRRVYALKYRVGRVQRTYTIGVHGSPWTAEEARDEAIDALGRIRDGEDPAAEKKAAREALTVAELVDAYLRDGPATKPAKRESTWANDASNLRRHVIPLAGRKIASMVSKADAARVIAQIIEGKTATDEKTKKRGRAIVKGGAGVARRTRMAAAAAYAWGLEHGLIQGANPFASVKLAAAPVRERFLSREEAGRMLDAIAELEAGQELSTTFGNALRLLLLTGARKTEILGLRWSEIDFERKSLLLPPERTKAGGKTGERRIILSPPALAILAARQSAEKTRLEAAERAGKPADASPYVFRAYRGEGPATGLRKAFTQVCAAAQLDGVRIHDLRHSFASFAIADGASLFLVGKLLGHANARTTERYAHLSGDPLQDAAALIGRRLMPAAEDEESSEASPAATGELVEFPSRA